MIQWGQDDSRLKLSKEILELTIQQNKLKIAHKWEKIKQRGESNITNKKENGRGSDSWEVGITNEQGRELMSFESNTNKFQVASI